MSNYFQRKKEIVHIPALRWTGTRQKIREQSPAYRFSKTDLSNGSTYNISLSGSPYDKYKPFNFLQITNKTDQDLMLTTDTVTKLIPSSVIISLDEETLPAYRKVEITNSSGSNATGDIEVVVQKVNSYRQVIKERLSNGF